MYISRKINMWKKEEEANKIEKNIYYYFFTHIRHVSYTYTYLYMSLKVVNKLKIENRKTKK